ncbi:MAG: uracil-DNA glycosylase [Bacteroidota bacterium]|nr:uracil-DNA glycosylase [Bacteroidota bacterium]
MKHKTTLINNDWDIILKDEFQKKAFAKLMQFIVAERKEHTIFPSEEKVFTALKLSSFSQTKIVIIGQDPYHGKGQAHGLAFSVPNGEKIPPTLRNILKELQSDLQIPIRRNGNLESWANQGVLLLNTILTVREKEAGSHQDLGWENFTDVLISKLSSEKNGLIFLLWGTFAQKKASLINHKKHYLLKTSHPSPLSAYRGFLGCKHFSKTNDILIKNNQKPIEWNLCSDPLILF